MKDNINEFELGYEDCIEKAYGKTCETCGDKNYPCSMNNWIKIREES